jgi:hypothetical protein
MTNLFFFLSINLHVDLAGLSDRSNYVNRLLFWSDLVMNKLMAVPFIRVVLALIFFSLVDACPIDHNYCPERDPDRNLAAAF